MVNKGKNGNSIVHNRIKLKSILSAYSEIWADVLYNKNLPAHLEKVEADISYLRILIQLYEKGDVRLLVQIKDDLIDLRTIMLSKISRSTTL